MSRLYVTWQEDDAYRQGQSDAARGRRDYERVSQGCADWDTPDKAYWDGVKDYQDELARKRRNEEQQSEYDAEYERWRRGL